MNVLVINCGSSTLKFELFHTDGTAVPDAEHRQAWGLVDRIGSRGTIQMNAAGDRTQREVAAFADHAQALSRVFEWLADLFKPDGLSAVGHRVVHGGERFTEPTLITDEVLQAIEARHELAPLHNGPALNAIQGARSAHGADLPMVAVFDTAFHRTLPPRAFHYAIRHDLAQKHGIRRFGFHGIAHRFMTDRYVQITAIPLQQVKLVTLQLGNGCSATAVQAGQSIDTSMGFTPLEGLVMGTRSGDIDPALVGFLAAREKASVQQVEDWLTKDSGLLGISGASADMRELLELERQGNARAALAVELFCYRVRKYIGAYLAVLGGADAVIFGGGIGENAPGIRARICAGMNWCGLTLDPVRNSALVGKEGRISAGGARIPAFVIPVDEALVIARDTVRLVRDQGLAGKNQGSGI